MMGVGLAMPPARRIAGAQQVFAVIVDDGRLTIEDVEKFVLCLMPMPVRGHTAGGQRLQMDAELGQPARVGQVD